MTFPWEGNGREGGGEGGEEERGEEEERGMETRKPTVTNSKTTCTCN